MNELEQNKIKSKRKYNDSKKNLQQKITELRIENEVIKKQLISLRSLLNDIIGKTESEFDKENK